jgi:hypothetical protein
VKILNLFLLSIHLYKTKWGCRNLYLFMEIRKPLKKNKWALEKKILLQVQSLKISVLQTLYFIWQFTSLVSQKNQRDGRQRGACSESDSPWVGVHTFKCNVLQLILRFYSPYLRKVLEVFSFGSQTCVISNKQLVYWTVKFCWVP